MAWYDPRGETALILFGTGGHAHSVVAALSLTPHVVVGRTPPAWTDVPLLTDDEEATDLLLSDPDLRWHVAIGDNGLRRTVAEAVAARVGWDRFASGSAATAEMFSDALHEGGVAIMSRTYVGPGATVGRGCILNTASVVEHDVRLGRWVHVSPSAVVLGEAVIEDMVWLGACATVLPGVHVGRGAVVGAGSVVRRDVPAGLVIAGVPARPLRRARRVGR